MFENLSLFRLKVFCEVVETQSFNIAAENLNISQPAVSAHIRSLEKETQVTLIQRGQMNTLTEIGKVFYEYAKNVLLQTNEISQVINEFNLGNKGTIILGANRTLARNMGAIAFSNFIKSNPNIELILRVANPKLVSQMTIDREVDFGFTIGNIKINGLKSEIIGRDEICFVVGKTHPLAKRKTVSIEELSTYPFIILADKEFKEFSVIENAINSQGIIINKKLMQIEDAEIIKKFVSQGMGVAALLKQDILEELNSGKLIKINLNIDPIYVNLQLIMRHDKYLSPVQNKFLKFFVSTIRELSA
jgi:DNA-binding transcriptional LysR family regulator